MSNEIKMVDLLDAAPDNLTIQDALGKALQQVRNHEKIMVAVSGGADSDVMIDLVIRCGGKDKTTFVFHNTGLEYEATKRQLRFLEEKYGIEIQASPPIKPIPLCVRQHGVPFWSKHVSEMIMRLQRHNFQWENLPFDVLYKKYPRCKAALRWWCNDWKTDNGGPSRLNIEWAYGLKEFLAAFPPSFAISPKCCHYAKKEPAKKYEEAGGFDLVCTGVRKAEGGQRSTGYTSCFSQAVAGADKYRPLFWFTDSDKAEYDAHYGIEHSDCYQVWGMKRTGCAGCPFGKDFEVELALAEKYEPNFHRAMLKVFGQSYEYTRQYLSFREELRKEEAEAKAEERGWVTVVNGEVVP